jgi:hypothetical protein
LEQEVTVEYDKTGIYPKITGGFEWKA